MAVAGHLKDTLEEIKVPKELIEVVLGKIMKLKGDIVGI